MADTPTFNPLPSQLQQTSTQDGVPSPGMMVPPRPPAAAPADQTAGMQPLGSDVTNIQPSPNAAQTADVAHHAALGKAVKFIMGSRTEYQPQADGSVKPVDVPSKPGDIFRGLLVSAMLGSGTKAHSFGEGFATGVSDSAQRSIQNKDKARNQAIQDEQMRQKKELEQAQVQHYSDEHTEAIARTASMTVQTAHSLYMIHHMPADNIDHVNATNQSLANAAYAAGGQDAQIVVDGNNINGRAGNARDLEAAINKNPNLATSPDKQHVRVPIYTTTMPPTAMVNDQGEWVDKLTKKPVDPLDYTSVRLIDQPIDTLTQQHTMTKDEVNKAVGSPVYKDDLDGTVSITQNDIMKMSESAQKSAMEQAKINLEKSQAARQDALAKKSVDIAEKNGQTALATLYKQNISSIDEAIKERQKADPTADVSDLQAQRTAANQEFIVAVSNINPNVQKAVTDARKQQQDQQDLQSKAVRQKQEALQKDLPKATKPGTPMTRDQKSAFAKASQSPQEAVSLAIANGFDPYAPSADVQQAGAALAGGGNPNPAPLSSSRPFTPNPEKPGSGPF